MASRKRALRTKGQKRKHGKVFKSDEVEEARFMAEASDVNRMLDSYNSVTPMDLERIKKYDHNGYAFDMDHDDVSKEVRNSWPANQAAVEAGSNILMAKFVHKRKVYQDKFHLKDGSRPTIGDDGTEDAPLPVKPTFDPRMSSRACAFERRPIMRSLAYADCEQFLPFTTMYGDRHAERIVSDSTLTYDAVGEVIEMMRTLINLTYISAAATSTLLRLPTSERVLVFRYVSDGTDAFDLVLWLKQHRLASNPQDVKWYIARYHYVPMGWMPRVEA